MAKGVKNHPVILPLALLFLLQFHGVVDGQQPVKQQVVGLSVAGLAKIVQVMQARGYNTAASLAGFAKGALQERTTLFVPTDAAILKYSLTQLPNLQKRRPQGLLELVRFHMAMNNFTFEELKHLPPGTFLPTALPGKYLQLSSSGPGGGLSIFGAKIVKANLCPEMASFLVTCQGIDQVLDVQTLGTLPAAAPPTVFP